MRRQNSLVTGLVLFVTVPQANATSSENTAKVAKQKLSTSWKGLPVKDSNKDKLKKEFSEMGMIYVLVKTPARCNIF